MKTCKRFQQFITRLAAKHGVNVGLVGAYLKLENPPYMPLVIENLDGYQVSVAHYRDDGSGDLQADPDVVLFTGYGDWMPIEITQPQLYIMGLGATRGYARYAELERGEDGRPRIARYYRKGQAGLASFVNQWGRNLKMQGWEERGQAVRSPVEMENGEKHSQSQGQEDQMEVATGAVRQLALW